MENSIEKENKGLKFLNKFKRNSDKYLLSFLLIVGGIGILIYSFPKDIKLEGGGILERKQVWTVIMAGVCLLITGIVSLIYSVGMISKQISVILVGVFLALTVVLGVYNVKSVKDPIAEIKYRRTRDNLSIKKLNDIRTAQLAFKKKKQRYARNFEELKGFLKNDFVIIPRKKELKVITVEVSELSEDSLIGDQSGISDGGIFNRNLLDDLFTYVYNGKNCNLILIGDDAQLPPVGSDISPALDLEEIRSRYDILTGRIELNEVVRQKENSGILVNATNIRHQQKTQPNNFPKFNTLSFDDIVPISGNDLQEYLDQEISNYGVDGAIVICRSNKRANLFNQQIRNLILWREEELSAGDLIMVVKNNYHWLKDESTAGFIANGDIMEITKIMGTQELYEFRFADVMVKLTDYPDIEPFECKIMLDVIYSEQPNLSREQAQLFYKNISEDYMDEKNKQKRKKKIFEDPFFNALQVKFAYAVTCHKSQGGQWPVVFVDQGYLTEEMINKEYLRWLYTAITRAEEKVYLVNFNSEFIDKTTL